MKMGRPSYCRHALTEEPSAKPATLAATLKAAHVDVDVLRAWQVDGIDGKALSETAKKVIADELKRRA
jgi:hypothetical protein